MRAISKAEKIDVLLALAIAFRKNNAASPGEQTRSLREIARETFGAMNRADLELLKSRAEFLDNLPEEDREIWRQAGFEKIRRRDPANRLDDKLNPSHIVDVLSREPKTIQALILKKLPADLSRKIAVFFDLSFAAPPESADQAEMIKDEIATLIWQKFLSNFVAFEDLYEPDILDGFSAEELEVFIRQIGLREVAIACRGINSKETLAAFLSRFEDNEAREIALYITELENIRPFWVAQADELVRRNWSGDLPPAEFIKKIGLNLLAAAFVFRDEAKCVYTGQKMTVPDAINWQGSVNAGKKKYLAAAEEDKTVFESRRSIIERLAEKFVRTGKF